MNQTYPGRRTIFFFFIVFISEGLFPKVNSRFCLRK